jgi:hypothetical protein
MLDPTQSSRAGDYAQMAEFAGFPEVGALALFYFFHHHNRQQQGEQQCDGILLRDPSKLPQKPDNINPIFPGLIDPKWLQQSTPPTGHCGCGAVDCGSRRCFVPMTIDQLHPIFDALEQYLLQEASSNSESTTPSANTILGIIAKNAIDQGSRQLVKMHSTIPDCLAFWKSATSANPVLQLLLLKLLYQFLPTLAATAVVELQPILEHGKSRQILSASHKSHWAYYVLIRSVVLGERIKPHRRWTLPAYHIPVWDVLWDKDDAPFLASLVTLSTERSIETLADGKNCTFVEQGDAKQWLKHLRNCLKFVSEQIEASTTTGVATVPLSWTLAPSKHFLHIKPLLVIGDSHVLSLAWQVISLQATAGTKQYRFIPIVITGLKAFHVRPEMRFFTNSNLHTCLQRLRCYYHHHNGCTVLFSAGEIDCREGIGGPELLEGYRPDKIGRLQSLIEDNVQEYVASLEKLRQAYPVLQQILVMPVAPHAQRTGGKVVGRGVRRRITHMWNDALRNALSPPAAVKGIYWLDYEASLRQNDASSPVGYVLNPYYNADNTHLNAAFLPSLQKAIQECGCVLDYL